MAMRKAHYDGGANNVQKQGPTDVLMTQCKPFAVTTAGAGTISPDAVLAGIIDRSGPGAGYTDTFPSALQLVNAIPEFSDQDSFEFLFRNTVAQAMTFASASASDVLVNANTAASLVRRYLVTLLAGGVGGILAATGVNGQNTIQVDPATLGVISGVNIQGNAGLAAANMPRFRVGQAVTGTNIAAGAVVTGINYTTGVITLSANNTGTVNTGATFLPRVEYRGIWSATL